jgi:hypothetical protein
MKREIVAMKTRSVRIIEAENQKHLAKVRAEKDGCIRLSEAIAYKEKRGIDSETVV